MDFWVVLGAVGSIASLVGLLVPIPSKQQRFIHAIYGAAITALTVVAVWYWEANQRIHRVEHGAQALLRQEELGNNTAGFIQAALAFLEKNRDLYPDSYARAQEICKLNHCMDVKFSNELNTNSVTFSYNMTNVADSLRGLILGISELESTK